MPSTILEQYAVRGDRFLVLRPAQDDRLSPLVVINNWRPVPDAPAAAPPVK